MAIADQRSGGGGGGGGGGGSVSLNRPIRTANLNKSYVYVHRTNILVDISGMIKSDSHGVLPLAFSISVQVMMTDYMLVIILKQ